MRQEVRGRVSSLVGVRKSAHSFTFSVHSELENALRCGAEESESERVRALLARDMQRLLLYAVLQSVVAARRVHTPRIFPFPFLDSILAARFCCCILRRTTMLETNFEIPELFLDMRPEA